MRDHFTFMRSYFEAISDLDNESQLEIYKAIAEYSLNETEVELIGISKTIFKLIKPVLEKGNNKSKNSSIQNRNKIETKTKQTKTKQKHTPLEERKGKEEDKETNTVLPISIISYYRDNISNLQSKIKESVSFKEIIKNNKDINKILTGLKNYAEEKIETKFIKSLDNFIKDKIYLDYQEKKKEEVMDGLLYKGSIY